jgi:CHAT domain-containing protein/Tfp pilus assembly protein PilF
MTLLLCILGVAWAQGQQKDYQKLYNDMVQAAKKKDYPTAIKHAEEMLPGIEGVLGKGSKQLGSFYYSVAGFYQAVKKYSKAEQMYQQSLAIRKTLEGGKAASYFKTQRRLARLYLQTQKLDKAAAIYTQMLDSQKTTLGENSPEYALTLYNLANLNKNLGKSAEAKKYYNQALTIQKASVGEQSLAYLNTVEGLAFLYNQEGNYAKAEPLFEKIWKTYKATVKNGNSNYIRAVGNLAEIYFAVGKYQAAEPLYNETVQLLKATKSPLYGRYLASWAVLREVQGRYDESEKLYTEAVEALKKEVGEQHPDYAQALHDFGKLYELKSEYAKAEEMMNKAQAIRAQAYGKNSPKYAESLNDLSKLYFKMGKLNQALNNAKQALAIRQKGNNEGATMVTTRNIANIYRTMKRFIDAEKYYKTILAYQKKTQGALHKEYLTTLNDLGKMYDDQNRLKKATETYKEVLKGRAKTLGANHPDYLRTAYDLAMLYAAEESKLDSAFNMLLELEKNSSILNKMPIVYANVLGSLGKIFYQRGSSNEAKKRFAKGVKVYPRRDERYINYINSLAASYAESGSYTTADSLYSVSLEVGKQKYGKHSKIYAITLNETGRMYKEAGRYDEALKNYRQTLQIEKKITGSNSPEYAQILHDFGVLFKEMGRYAESEQSFSNAKKIRVVNPGRFSEAYATTLNDVGNLYKAMGRYKKAEKVYVEALEIRRKTLGKHHADYASSLNALARIYDKIDKKDEALKLYKEARDIRKEVLGEQHPDYAVSLDNLAGWYRKEGNKEEAEKNYLEALAIRGVALGNDHPDYAASLNNLAVFYQEQNKLAEAGQAYKQTLDIFKNKLGENHPDYGRVLRNLAVFYEERGKLEEAEKYFIKAVKIVLRQINTTFPSLSEDEKKQFYLVNKDFIDGFMRFAFSSSALRLKQGQTKLPILGDAYNLQLATKALILNSTSKVRRRIMASGNQALIQKYEDWQGARETIARLYNLGKAALDPKNIKDLKAAELLANSLERELSAKAEGFKGAYNPSLPTWRDVQKQLKSGEAAIEMIRLRTGKDSIYYSVLIVKPDTKDHPAFLTIRNAKKLESRYLAYYKNAIRFKREDRYSYKMFWKPIAKALKGVKKVYFSPDGVYNQISLNTLLNRETQKYVLDELEVAMVTNTRDILNLGKRSKNRKKAVLMGHPKYLIDPANKTNDADTKKTNLDAQKDSWLKHAVFADLPGTAREVKGIQNVLKQQAWNVEINLEANAHEGNLKKLRNPSILHIATHGFFIPSLADQEDNSRGVKIKAQKKKKSGDDIDLENDPMLRSGLILAGVTDYFNAAIKPNSDDGVLTAYEAMSLNLDQTDLVVLSACETGLGKVQNGEGVYGLQRALKIAGARTVLMSLWKVNDDATQKLMNAFYTEWLKSGNKRDAFQKAQQKIKADENYKHPYYWGAFVMVGE